MYARGLPPNRKQLLFSYDALDQAQATLNKLYNRISSIKVEGELQKDLFDKYNNLFIEYMSDDLNTANALTVLYDVIKDDELTDFTKLYLVEFINTPNKNII